MARRALSFLVTLSATAISGAQAQDVAVARKSAASDGSPPTCARGDTESATVTRIVDARTVLLADGRELRLAGIEMPASGEPHALEATAALERHLTNRKLVLRRVGDGTDRHGRLLAHAFAAFEPDGPSLQQHLLGEGAARVAARVGNLACATALLTAESRARTAGLGLWKAPYYATRRAENPGEILAQRGRFALVEGRVISVRESGGLIYINFGRRWSEDFTVTVLRRHERKFAAEGFDVRKLAGRDVRVRGTVEERGGPWIEASRPEQFEIAGRD